jgi:hypothetical protein
VPRDTTETVSAAPATARKVHKPQPRARRDAGQREQAWNSTTTSVIWLPNPENARPTHSRRNAGDERSGTVEQRVPYGRAGSSASFSAIRS